MKASCDIMRSILDNVLLTDAGKVEVIKKFVNGEDIEDLFIKCPICGETMTDCVCDIPASAPEELAKKFYVNKRERKSGMINISNEDGFIVDAIQMTTDNLQIGDWVRILGFDEIEAMAYKVHEYESGWKAYQIELDKAGCRAMCFNQDMIQYCGLSYKIVNKMGDVFNLEDCNGEVLEHLFTISMFKYAERGI